MICFRLEEPSPPYDSGYDQEFYQLHREAEENAAHSNCDEALGNLDKNRYIDILPYDATRVKLRDNACDFINAVCVRVAL